MVIRSVVVAIIITPKPVRVVLVVFPPLLIHLFRCFALAAAAARTPQEEDDDAMDVADDVAPNWLKLRSIYIKYFPKTPPPKATTEKQN